MINKILKIWFKIHEKIRFFLVGGYNTVFAYLLFCLLNYLLENKLHYLAILLISHLISVLNSFATFKYFVFRSNGHILAEYLKTNIVYAGYFICNAILLYILKDWLFINIYISQFACICVLFAATYFAHKHFSFKRNA